MCIQIFSNFERALYPLQIYNTIFNKLLLCLITFFVKIFATKKCHDCTPNWPILLLVWLLTMIYLNNLSKPKCHEIIIIRCKVGQYWKKAWMYVCCGIAVFFSLITMPTNHVCTFCFYYVHPPNQIWMHDYFHRETSSNHLLYPSNSILPSQWRYATINPIYTYIWSHSLCFFCLAIVFMERFISYIQGVWKTQVCKTKVYGKCAWGPRYKWQQTTIHYCMWQSCTLVQETKKQQTHTHTHTHTQNPTLPSPTPLKKKWKKKPWWVMSTSPLIGWMKILLLKEFVVHFLPRLIGTPIHGWATYSKNPTTKKLVMKMWSGKVMKKNVFQYDNGNFMISPRKKVTWLSRNFQTSTRFKNYWIERENNYVQLQ